jgi:ketosteroid isomerase-like protein
MRSVFAMLLLLAGACQGARSDSIAVRRVIEANNTNIIRWYANGRADSVGSVFAQDAWQLPPNSQPLVGRDSIIAFWRNAMRTGRWNFELTARDVVVNGSLAVERGSYTVAFEAGPNAPHPSFQDRGNYVVVWRKEPDGVWRAVWDAPVSTLPPSQPASK